MSLLACSAEPEPVLKPIQPVEEPPTPEPVLPPAKEPIIKEVPEDPPEAASAPLPEPVILNAMDQNVTLPIYRHKDSGCYVLVPSGQNDGSLNPVYQRIPTECPEEMLWESWDNCREGEIWQIGETCECRIMVGQPKPEPTSIACPMAPEPEPEPEPEAENTQPEAQ